MRISVACGGFDDASDAARTANQVTALATDTLTAKLAGLAGMAGNDSASTEFAAAYDDGAREAVAALADLAHAFIGLGRLLAATGTHHAQAESAVAGQVLGSVSAGLTSDAYVVVVPTVPPSSLGAQEPSFGAVDRWILDHVEGFVWPSGDVDLLRDAATTWRRASESVAGFVDHLASARAFVEAQVSPEVPVVLTCLADVRSLVVDVAAELAALGVACDEHAAAIEAVHERTRALLEEVASMAIEGVAISALITAVSGPLGGSLGMGALLARIRAVAPRFHALISTLRVSVASTAARLRTGRTTLSELRVRLERYVRVGVRDERGAASVGGWGRAARSKFSSPQLQKKFKHASDFGIDGPYNPAAAERFKQALRSFMGDASTKELECTMRGQPGKVVAYVDQHSRRCVVCDADGNFISGWRLSPTQLSQLLSKGHLGGG
ncbi:hypothetical protein KDN32_02490 [Nocardioides sp. J2M5]|uniref:colicin D domain-containing protein n=1 Tax=Nocardioides palaemonis TaxID=2829810 RepID=UPI001BAAA60C|nr:colicin D domain-containing protein [Nocardioides palaemonis]MBS2936608.1 hypothetical protein [Nocardioides palaemonis]